MKIYPRLTPPPLSNNLRKITNLNLLIIRVILVWLNPNPKISLLKSNEKNTVPKLELESRFIMVDYFERRKEKSNFYRKSKTQSITSFAKSTDIGGIENYGDGDIRVVGFQQRWRLQGGIDMQIDGFKAEFRRQINGFKSKR